MRKFCILIFTVVSLFIFSACNSGENGNLQKLGVATKNTNNQLKLTAPSELSNFSIGNNLGLVLINESNLTITLPPDYGVQIYQQIDREWKPVENTIEYSTNDKVIFPRQGQPLRDVILVVHPSVVSAKPVKIRVAVVGNFRDDLRVGDKVGAYVDIVLNSD